MTMLKIADMHCENCVKRISKALDNAKLQYSVDLRGKTVSIDGDEAQVKIAISELDDLGFDAVKM